MQLESGLPGFSPVVLVSRKEIEELQQRVKTLLEANSRLVQKRRNLQRQVNSLSETVREIEFLTSGRENAPGPMEVQEQVTERVERGMKYWNHIRDEYKRLEL